MSSNAVKDSEAWKRYLRGEGGSAAIPAKSGVIQHRVEEEEEEKSNNLTTSSPRLPALHQMNGSTTGGNQHHTAKSQAQINKHIQSGATLGINGVTANNNSDRENNATTTGGYSGGAGGNTAAFNSKIVRKRCVPHFQPAHDFLFHLSDETNGVPKDPPPMLKQFVHQLATGHANKRKGKVLPPHMLPPKASTVANSYSFLDYNTDEEKPTNFNPRFGAAMPSFIPKPPRLHGSETQEQQDNTLVADEEEERVVATPQSARLPLSSRGSSRASSRRGQTGVQYGDAGRSAQLATPMSARSTSSSFSARGDGMVYVSAQRMLQLEEKVAKDEEDKQVMFQKMDKLQTLLEEQIRKTNRLNRKQQRKVGGGAKFGYKPPMSGPGSGGILPSRKNPLM